MQFYAEKRLTRLVTHREEANKVGDEICVSHASRKSRKSKSGSVTSATSSARAECLKVELERAAQLAKQLH